jgi:iron complex transport system substrate-binding protein
VKIKMNPKRIMALSSSITEMLYVICDEEEIVGRTHNCNYPPQCLRKPIINNYPIDFENVLMLNPDLVFAKDGIISIEEAQKIESMGIPVYFQHYEKVEDIFSGMIKLGKLLGHEKRALSVADSLRALKNRIQDSVDKLPRPKVLMIISKEKIFVFGEDSYASDMLKSAGGVNAVDSVFSNSFPQLTSEYIIHINPDIVIGGEPVDLDGSFFKLYPELKKINAYKNKKLYTVPDEILSRPGPRAVEAILLLKNIIHKNAK